MREDLNRDSELSTVALAMGISEPEARKYVALLRVMENRSALERARRRRVTAVVASVVCAAGAFLWGAPALAQAACSQTLPSPLVTLCADTPAVASEVNGNFQQLVSWVQQKVGTVGNANISTAGTLSTGAISSSGAVTATGAVTSSGAVTGASLSTAGNLTASRLIVNDGVIQRGGGLITATGDLGLYSRVAGSWMRLVTNNAPIRFFTAEGTTGVGDSYMFSIEIDGAVTSRYGGEGEGTLMLPGSFCVIVPQANTCPTNWDLRQVKWDTEDSSNADSGKDGKIASDNGNSGSVLMRFCCRGAGW